MKLATSSSLARIFPVLTACALTGCLDAEPIDALEADLVADDDADDLATEDSVIGDSTPAVDSLRAEVGPVARLPGFNLAITLDDAEVALTWLDQGAAEYEVWRSRNPYFVPPAPGQQPSPDDALDETQLLATVTDLAYTDDLGEVGPATADFYYAVQAVSALPALSTTVGRHSLMFFTTATGGYNLVPMSLEPLEPLVPPPALDLLNAEDVFDAMAPDAIDIFLINAQSDPDAFLQWNPTIGSAPFLVEYGSVPIMEMTLGTPDSPRAIAGYVPSVTDLDVTLYPGRNDVVLPLHFPDVLASDLLQAMEGSVARVGRFDAGTQQEIWVDSADPQVDVLIPSGGDLYIELPANAEEIAWPIGLGELPADDTSCCQAHGTPGCSDAAIEEVVCTQDAFCCETQWDNLCVTQARDDAGADCRSNGCDTANVPGSTNGSLEACVCAQDAYCCTNAWDSLCVTQAGDDCGAPC